MKNKQTAVEFLLAELDIAKLIAREKLTMAGEVVRQAKAMEKEQIMKANYDGFIEGINIEDNDSEIISNEQYYEKTYGK